ncbi:MAG: hypothetical protein HKP43_10645 [Altererythrobacter sp.]|nr:hypothetical protein [Altererythrobacter sp.]NNE49292.1 hypothetical protein [Altererythrobacter sp.]NNK47065.1 hypothetical protein [Altererythrobacter sp.]
MSASCEDIAPPDGGAQDKEPYDETPLVTDLYSNFRRANYNLSYSVRNGGSGREVMFFSSRISNLDAFQLGEQV